MFKKRGSDPKPRPRTMRAKLTLEDRFNAVGCCPDKHDERDHILFQKSKKIDSHSTAATGERSIPTNSVDSYTEWWYSSEMSHLPPLVDMRSQMPPVLDQGTLSSCVTNAIANQIRYTIAKSRDFKVDYKYIDIASRLSMYLDARLFERVFVTYSDEMKPLETVRIADDGLITLRSAYHIARHRGFASEFSWPYLSSLVNVYPSEYHRTKALSSAKRIQYLRVPNTREMYNAENSTNFHEVIKNIDSTTLNSKVLEICTALAEGHVICVGIPLYNSQIATMETSNSFTIPDVGESPIGGHAVLLVGYDASQGVFLLQNTWGKDVGMKGYFSISMLYIVLLGWDFWTVVVSL